MAYCTNCGREVAEEIRFCPHCGKEQAPRVEVIADPQDIADTKVLSILAYLGILVLVTIFAAPKKSVFARYHANQGLILLIVNGIFAVIGAVLGVVGHWSRILAVLLSPVNMAMSAAGIFLAVIGIIHAARGEMKELPVIGKYRILK